MITSSILKVPVEAAAPPPKSARCVPYGYKRKVIVPETGVLKSAKSQVKVVAVVGVNVELLIDVDVAKPSVL